MKKLITTCAFLMLITGIYAQTTFTVGGIVFITTSANTVAVTSKTTQYTGSITIPSSVVYSAVTYNVTSIGNYAFQSCTGLTSITIPNSVTLIGDLAFQSCTGLSSITIPSSVTSIGSNAFSLCDHLTSVSIPSSVTSIGEVAFTGCSSLTSINVNAANPNYSSLNGVLFNKNNTIIVCYPGGKQGTYIIPSSVTSIGYVTFSYCTGLTSITIPSSVTSFGSRAFKGCTGLTSITIPNTVTSIGYEVFYGCTHLTSIYTESATPVDLSSSSSVFFNVNKTSCTLYVPAGSLALYQAANQWKDFTNIVKMSTGLQPISQSNIKIMTDYGKLIISNVETGSSVQVFTVSGLKVKEQRVESNHTIISLMSGIYLLRVGNYSDKVIVR